VLAIMADSPGFAYVQPRLQARYAARPSDAEWRLMDASADVEHYLQAARQTSLKPWMDHLGIETSSRDIEAAFREEWAERVAEASRWPPPAWSPAVTWLRWIPWLPAIAHLGAGGAPLVWLRTELQGTGAAQGPARLPEALTDAGPSPESAWLAQWRLRLPARGSWSEDLVALAAAHREAMASAALPGPVLRLAFAEALRHRFRRYAGGPGALFAWLLLAGTDAERLRYGLLRLRLVPQPARVASWA
jgi:hypothetical protein